jgi:UDP-2,3-diacylglucosamine pyrophosphatase LpxH
MSTNRRQFLVGAGLAGLGLAAGGKLLADLFDADRLDDRLAATPTPTSKLLHRFAVVADTGSGNINQYAVGRALARYHQKSPFDRILLAGDNIYTNGEFSKIKEAFAIPYKDLLDRGVKFYASLGNHDVRSANGDLQVAYPQFNMQGKRYYTHGTNDVKFFVLETNEIVDSMSAERMAQLAWLDRELGASKAKWNIVYGHHNIYSAGVYKINAIMERDVTPILKKHNVKLWINGHDHNYQRSQPIDGITYLVCGGGGATLYPVEAQSWTAFAQQVHSFGVVEVYADQLLITGIDSKSEIIDRGIVKLT